MAPGGRHAGRWAGVGMSTDLGREPMKSKRAALDAPVRSLNHGQDPNVQLRELRAYCGRRGFEIIGEYVDKGVSGSREQRPALDKLLADCRKRLVDAIVVYRFDRFARTLANWIHRFIEGRLVSPDGKRYEDVWVSATRADAENEFQSTGMPTRTRTDASKLACPPGNTP
jgi:hypothetical protein